MDRSTIDLIRKYALPGQRILDVGVGMGRALSHFSEPGRFGVDISIDYLEEAHKKGINICHGLVEEMPYIPGLFDIVVHTDVLDMFLISILPEPKFLILSKKRRVDRPRPL